MMNAGIGTMEVKTAQIMVEYRCREGDMRNVGLEVTNMAFKAAFIAHAPDGDAEKHRCIVETPKYKLFVVVVRDQSQANEVCGKLVEEEGIHQILLCPGFTHRDVAEIAEVVGKDVGVSVARGDGPGMRASMEVLKREWGLKV
jgi:hypothetical protein